MGTKGTFDGRTVTWSEWSRAGEYAAPTSEIQIIAADVRSFREIDGNGRAHGPTRWVAYVCRVRCGGPYDTQGEAASEARREMRATVQREQRAAQVSR